MFAIIEHQQRAFRFERAHEILEGITFGGQAKTERVRDGRRKVVAAGKGREFDEPRAVARAVEEIRSNLQRGARFADSTGPHERDQPMHRQ